MGARLGRGVLVPGLVLAAFGIVPAVLCQFLAHAPQDRYYHIEAFRYGKEPSVIRCNRGDRLHLTFSTRDTGHSFFLEEFDLDAKISPGADKVEVFRTSQPEDPPEIRQEVVFEARHPGWLGWLVSKSQYRCHTWCGLMHAFEHGNLVLWPNTLLAAGLGLVVGIPIAGLIGLRARAVTGTISDEASRAEPGIDLLRLFPWLKWLLRRRQFPFAILIVMMALLYVIVLAALFGTKVAGRNLGVMTVWVIWLFLLTAVFVPWGGRLWCMLCPLPMLGDMAQRGMSGVRSGSTGGTHNHFFGLNRAWPRALANDWPRTIGFLILGTFSTALVAVPRVTGVVVLGLLVLATVMAFGWELRAFCRFLCPVTAFVGLYGRAGKLALRAANPQVCAKCPRRPCQTGSERGWACPFGLCVGEIRENVDCGLCAECFKTCPYDNVTLRWRGFAEETGLRSLGEAWLAMTMLVLGTAYCLVHLGHWPFLRDCVNVLDKGNWDLFGLFAAVLWLIALVGLPGLMIAASAAGKRWSRTERSLSEILTAASGSLVPMGLLVWIAFVLPMLLVNVSFVRQALSDPFGWGWDFLGTSNTPWHQVWPRALPWMQVGAVLVGLSYSLRNAWRIWLGLAGAPRAALAGMTPLGACLVAYSGCLVWFFAN